MLMICSMLSGEVMMHDSGSPRGMTLLDTITVVLIILKFFNLISISWWQVFIPTFIEIALVIILLLIYWLMD